MPAGIPQPLQGRTVLVTRAAGQAGALAVLLRDAGASVLEVPTIRIEAPPSWQPLDEALAMLGSFTWVVFTSANAVGAVDARLRERGSSMNAFARLRVGAVGPATAEALTRAGLGVAALPDEHRAEALVEQLRPAIGAGDRVLFPCGAGPRDVLPTGLRSLGAEVLEVPVYVTRPVTIRPPGLHERLLAGEIHVLTFTSPSTVRAFAAMFSRSEQSQWRARVRVGVIGPVTAAAAQAVGLTADIIPDGATMQALVTSIIADAGACAR
jgi:uroporphyrinogen III methyltransferase/synthase